MFETAFFYAIIEIVCLTLFYQGDSLQRRNIRTASIINDRSSVYTRTYNYNSRHKRKNISTVAPYFIAGLILYLIVGFRDLPVGTDYQLYHDAIIRVAENRMMSFDTTWLSLGFRAIIKILAFIGVSSKVIPYIVISIIAIITIYFFFKAFLEFSSSPFWSLTVFFSFCLYFQMMNQFRQIMAVAIGLYAFKYVGNKTEDPTNKGWGSFVKYCLIIILASLFHGTAIILLPMYFVCKLKLTRRLLWIYLGCGILALVIYPFLRSLIAYTSYANYLGWETYDTSGKASAYFNLLVRIVLLMLVLAFRKRIVGYNPKNECLYHYVIICTILQVVVINVTLFSRVTTYFYVAYTLLIPELIKSVRSTVSRESKAAVNIMAFLALFIYQVVYYVFTAQGAGYNVYHTIFCT